MKPRATLFLLCKHVVHLWILLKQKEILKHISKLILYFVLHFKIIIFVILMHSVSTGSVSSGRRMSNLLTVCIFRVRSNGKILIAHINLFIFFNFSSHLFHLSCSLLFAISLYLPLFSVESDCNKIKTIKHFLARIIGKICFRFVILNSFVLSFLHSLFIASGDNLCIIKFDGITCVEKFASLSIANSERNSSHKI